MVFTLTLKGLFLLIGLKKTSSTVIQSFIKHEKVQREVNTF